MTKMDGLERAMGRKGFSRKVVLGFVLAAAVLCAVAYAVQQISIMLNGRQLSSKAIMYNQQVYVPMSVLREIPGMKVRWDGGSQTVLISTGEEVGTPEASPHRPSSSTVLFEDNFDHGLRPEWKMDPPRSWSPANGDFLVTEIGGDKRAFAFVGDRTWSDYCIDLDIGVADAGKYAPKIFLICRAKGRSDYVAFVIHPWRYEFLSGQPSECYWVIVKAGKASVPISPQRIDLKREDSLHIRLIARGQTLTVYRNAMEEPFASYGAADIGGGVGLMLEFPSQQVYSEAFFDNFRVQKLSPGEALPPYPEMKKWSKSR
jgi:hypothetical protein